MGGWSGSVGQERRRFFRAEVGRDGRAQEFEYGATLLRARLNDSPDAFAPAASIFTAGALRDPAMDGDKANRLFRQVVGRFDIRFGDEAEIAVRVLTETLCQIESLSTARCSACGIPDQLGTGRLQGPLEVLRARIRLPPGESPRRVDAGHPAATGRTLYSACRGARPGISRRGSGGPGRIAAGH